MTEGEDRIYKQRMERIQAFQFDARVAEVFDNMIRRSVPGYATVEEMIELLTRRYALAGTCLYDLGCSLGTGLGAMRRGAQGRPVSLIGVDTSAPMLARCQELLELQATASTEVLPAAQLICADARTVPLAPASVVIMNFTLQFVSLPDRLPLLRRIHEALVPGGVLILSEKLSFEPEQRTWLEGLHDEFRKGNGYTELELSQKRAALEDVLFPEPAEVHLTRLTEAGFTQRTPWFQCLNFASFLAMKSPKG
ncbi:MAG: tRNA (cmo5U34)-methyltransferase [Pseudomonadota bacterium]|jgi:tRNA (cmo5U34)-methyltransferase